MRKTPTYSDIEFVAGLQRRDPAVEEAFYFHCKNYFNKNWKSVFFAPESEKDDIFHEAFRTIWKNIDDKIISIKDKTIVGRNGRPLRCKITTYLMSIARLKNLEISRSKPLLIFEDEDTLIQGCDSQAYQETLYGNDDESRWRILTDCISQMKESCMRILTLFYIENKRLDEILEIMPSFSNKDSLKSKKHDCLKTLREQVESIYRLYIG